MDGVVRVDTAMTSMNGLTGLEVFLYHDNCS